MKITEWATFIFPRPKNVANLKIGNTPGIGYTKERHAKYAKDKNTANQITNKLREAEVLISHFFPVSFGMGKPFLLLTSLSGRPIMKIDRPPWAM